MKQKQYIFWVLAIAVVSMTFNACKPKGAGSALSGNAAERVYIPPGQHDEFYNFVSGGFSGQMTVYGLPSGRLLKLIPVFSVNAENGWGFSEETKPMLETSHGFVPWDDLHHIESSFTDGMPDGRWMFANSNNTPRLARIDLTTFRTAEIIEIPNAGGNHCSPFTTQNSEYVIAATRFSVPPDGPEGDVPISSYKENFKGHISFVSVDPESGEFDISFQLKTPGLNFDLSSAGKGVSDGWLFLSCYNSEQAHTLLEVNASKNDKDFILAVNWKKAEEYFKAGHGVTQSVRYAHNKWDDEKHLATSEIKTEVTVLDISDFDDVAYLIPCPKSPHGADVNPTGEYIVGSGKLASLIPVFSFSKMMKAIEEKKFDGDYDGIPVLNYETVLHGEVEKPGLGPLHTEFDANGNAYTSFFVSSEVVKWNVKSLQVIDRQPTYYSTGHLTVAGGNTKKPYGKYLVAWNKITKDRYLPTGPELAQSAQLFDISGDKMELLLDFPTIGEPHYAQIVPASLIVDKQKRIYDINANTHKYVVKNEDDTRVVRNGNRVDVYMTTIRTHIAPDNIEGIRMGDEVYFHITNLEQDWDLPHGFAVMGNNNSELLILPGETRTLKWIPTKVGIIPMYCTDFCSALHQEMQGYIRVSPAGSNTPLRYGIGDKAPKAE